MTNPFSGKGNQFSGTKAHHSIWEVSGVGHHHSGGTTKHKDVFELGWAAKKMDAAKAFINKHAPKYKLVDIHHVMKLR